MHPPELPLRALSAEDVETVAALWRRAWASSYPEITTLQPHDHWVARVRAEFFAPSEAWLLAPDGTVGAFLVLDRDKRYLAQLFVDPALHGHGWGRALLGEACRRMPAGWHLHVGVDNRMAQRFYTLYGLVRGAIDRHPVSGRERVEYRWLPPAA